MLYLDTAAEYNKHWFETFGVGNIVTCVPIEQVVTVTPLEEDGFIMLRRKRYDEAASIFKRAIAKDPAGYTASFGLCQALYPKLSAAFKEARALYGKSAQGKLTRADLYRSIFLTGLCGRNKSYGTFYDDRKMPFEHADEFPIIDTWAREKYQQLLSSSPSSPLEALFMASVHDQIDWKLVGVRNYLRKSIKSFSKNPWLHFSYSLYLGASEELGSYKEPRDTDGQLAELEEAVKLKPDYPSLRLYLAFTYLEKKQKDLAHLQWVKAQELGIVTAWDKELAKAATKNHL